MSTEADAESFDCINYGLFRVPVVGESHYQAEIASVIGERTWRGYAHTIDVRLVLEDTNAFDDKAVVVRAEGVTIGYLSRDDARRHREAIEKMGIPRATAVCRAIICGGWDRGGDKVGDFGVKLDLTFSEY